MNSKYTLIGSFPMLWKNWEGNPEGYILENSRRKIIYSYDKYGKEKISMSELQAKIDEYRNAIYETKKALGYLSKYK